MRTILQVLFSLVCLAGCSKADHRVARRDVDVKYIDLGFPTCGDYRNPYTIEDIALTNRYIEGRLEFYRVSEQVEVYLVPRNHDNRLLFFAVDPEFEFSRELSEKIFQDVKQFLASRPPKWVQNEPNQVSEGSGHCCHGGCGAAAMPAVTAHPLER
jgi:hypothetical protein